jgi:hypothetical protein
MRTAGSQVSAAKVLLEHPAKTSATPQPIDDRQGLIAFAGADCPSLAGDVLDLATLRLRARTISQGTAATALKTAQMPMENRQP